MNEIIATAQQILDFKVGNISVGSVIQGLNLLIIFNRIISMIMGPIIDKILGRFKLETTIQGFIKGFIKVILNFVALCVVADSIGIPIASVLAVVGMLGLAISLSVQGALSNVANGFLILVTKPFKVGDYVAIAGIEGFVKDVGMLCTKVLSIDNKLIIGTSRNAAMVGLGNTTDEAEWDCEVALSCVNCDYVYMRHDIGKASLIKKRVEHMNRLRSK